MHRIFFDHQKFSTQKYGGISRYFTGIIESLYLRDGYDVIFGVLHSQNEYLKNISRSGYSWLDLVLNSRYSRKTYRLNQFYCQRLLKSNEFSLFHPMIPTISRT